MYVISDAKVNVAIKKFIEKQSSFYGQSYATVAEKDKVFMEQFLNRFYHAFCPLFSNKHTASEIFVNRLLQIDAVRLDDADKEILPLKYAFDEIKRYCGENMEGGLLMPSIINGVILLDMDCLSRSKPEWLHTLIHEMIHAMVLVKKEEDGEEFFQTGIAQYGRVFFKLNEGITEIIAQLVWSQMYKNKQCPGVGRYANEVKAANILISKIMNKENFVEQFLIDSNFIMEELGNIVNNDDESMGDVINKLNSANLYNSHDQKNF